MITNCGQFQVLMIYMKMINNEDFVKQLVKKMAPPLGQKQKQLKVDSSHFLFPLRLTATRVRTRNDANHSYALGVGARGPIRRFAEYQPHPAEAAGRPLERGPCLLLQVQ